VKKVKKKPKITAQCSKQTSEEMKNENENRTNSPPTLNHDTLLLFKLHPHTAFYPKNFVAQIVRVAVDSIVS